MKKNTWIVIPTYWGHRGSSENPPVTQFDHPTDITTEGTLARTLESISKLDGNFKVLLIVASTHAELNQEVHEKVTSIAQEYTDKLSLYLVSPQNLHYLQAQLPEPILALTSYGNIRNVQLLLPYLAGADNIVAIDDDEVIPDKNFLHYSEKYLLSSIEDDVVHGMAGPYYSNSGHWEINNSARLKDEPNLFLKKNYYMNEGVTLGMGVKNIGVCNIAFGGNMVFSREVIKSACHDPYCPRGEDYDYVLNAFYAGHKFYFCPEMKITHLPPDSDGSQAADNPFKLIADINRFIYQKEKVKSILKKNPTFDTSYLYPYPGIYLDDNIDLAQHAKDALITKYKMSHDSAEKIVKDAQKKASIEVEKFWIYLNKWCYNIENANNNFSLDFFML